MQRQRSAIRRDWWAGGAMIAIGIGALVESMNYSWGSLANMGPGLFPAVLGVLLIFLGLVIAKGAPSALSKHSKGSFEEIVPPQWRGWGCIIGALLAFILVGKFGGLIPATFVLVFVSAMGDRKHTLRSAVTLAVAVTVIGVLVFSWGLQLQFPLFRWG